MSRKTLDELRELAQEKQSLESRATKSRRALVRYGAWVIPAASILFFVEYSLIKMGLEIGVGAAIGGAVVGLLITVVPIIIIVMGLVEGTPVAIEHSKTSRELTQTKHELEAAPVGHGLALVEPSQDAHGALSVGETGGQLSLDDGEADLPKHELI